MPQDGSNNYQYPPGTRGVPDQTIESEAYNTFLDDLVVNDLNIPRPVHRGGTGANVADEGLANLAGERATQVVTNFDSHVWLPGSFRSSNTTGQAAPVDGHAFAGICYLNEPFAYPPTNQNLIVEARDESDTVVPGRVYVRQKKAGVWDTSWSEQTGDVASTDDRYDDRYVNLTGDTMTGLLTLSGEPTADLHAATKLYVDAGVGGVGGGLAGKVSKAGDTMTGHLVLPTGPAASNAVRRDYVDTRGGGLAVKNGKIFESHVSDAATFSLKTLADADPSVTDPISALFSDGTSLTITAPLSITVSSGSTLGTGSAVAFRLWILLFNDAGTPHLGVINCSSAAAAGGVFGLDSAGISNSSAEGGAGGADMSGVIYTSSALVNKPYLIVGNVEYDTGQPAAGTWSVAPTWTVQYGPHIPLPGAVMQVRMYAGGAEVTTTSTSDQLTNMNGNITIHAKMNRVLIQVSGVMRQITSTGVCRSRLYRGASTGLGPSLVAWNSGGATDLRVPSTHVFLDVSANVGSTTYNIYVSSDTSGQNVGYGSGTMILQEIQG